MSFIARVIGPDEKKIGIVTAHWVYGLKGLFWLLAFILLGFVINRYVIGFIAAVLPPATYDLLFSLSSYIMTTCIVIGGLIFFFLSLKMLTTEIGLTDRRVILKTGLLMVDVKEIDIEEIKAGSVDNGWFGRVFNYGYIRLDSRFVRDIRLAAIGDPYRFMKALNEAKTILAEDSLHIVLGEKGAAAKDHLSQVEATNGSGHDVHEIDEPRYQTLEPGSIKAAEHIGRDVKESLRTKTTPGVDISTGSKPAPQQPQQTAPRQPAAAPVQPQQRTEMEAPTLPPAPAQKKSKSEPIIFRKEIMRENFKEDFGETA